MPREDTDSPPEPKFPDRRFRPQQRLRRRRDFARVLSGGIRLNVQFATIVVRPNGVDHSRLGLAVSRRVARSAVTRHTVKRHIRESFRHHGQLLAGLDVVVLAKSGAATMDARRLRVLLTRGWNRVAGMGWRHEGKRSRREPHDGH